MTNVEGRRNGRKRFKKKFGNVLRIAKKKVCPGRVGEGVNDM